MPQMVELTPDEATVLVNLARHRGASVAESQAVKPPPGPYVCGEGLDVALGSLIAKGLAAINKDGTVKATDAGLKRWPVS